MFLVRCEIRSVYFWLYSSPTLVNSIIHHFVHKKRSLFLTLWSSLGTLFGRSSVIYSYILDIKSQFFNFLYFVVAVCFILFYLYVAFRILSCFLIGAVTTRGRRLTKLWSRCRHGYESRCKIRRKQASDLNSLIKHLNT